MSSQALEDSQADSAREGGPAATNETEPSRTPVTLVPRGEWRTRKRRGSPLDNWEQAFIEALKDIPVVRRACDVAGVSRATAYRHKADDEAFSVAWDTALEEGADLIEESAWDLAVNGREEITETYDKEGKVVRRTIKVVHDTRLHELLLKGQKAEKYVDRLRLGKDPDDQDVDQEILGAAREIARRLREQAELPAAPAPGTVDDDGVIEAVVVEPGDVPE